MGNRRAQKALELGAEPSDAGAPVSTLMLRLADGSRVRRRFLRSDVMEKVLDWADVQGVDLEAQRLSSTFPKVRTTGILLLLSLLLVNVVNKVLYSCLKYIIRFCCCS